MSEVSNQCINFDQILEAIVLTKEDTVDYTCHK